MVLNIIDKSLFQEVPGKIIHDFNSHNLLFQINKRKNYDIIRRKNKGKKMYFCHSKYKYEYESSYCL